jgi:hypothetical protein
MQRHELVPALLVITIAAFSGNQPDEEKPPTSPMPPPGGILNLEEAQAIDGVDVGHRDSTGAPGSGEPECIDRSGWVFCPARVLGHNSDARTPSRDTEESGCGGR